MRDSEAFRTVTRGGKRVSQPDLVVHLAPSSKPTDSSSVGFVVSKQVGNAVVRNRVKRRLKHVVRDRLGSETVALDVVVRALPSAANSTSAELATQLDRALERVEGSLRA